MNSGYAWKVEATGFADSRMLGYQQKHMNLYKPIQNKVVVGYVFVYLLGMGWEVEGI